MSIKPVIQNPLTEDASSVWLLQGHDRFAYTDGVASEQYLEKVFLASKDLSSRSSELESHIKDWSSEYQLTTKRAQLLSGFEFDRSMKVLEVGCGCGAITRYLGKTFDSVVSVEGSIARARLARLRTRDLPSVSDRLCSFSGNPLFRKIRYHLRHWRLRILGLLRAGR